MMLKSLGGLALIVVGAFGALWSATNAATPVAEGGGSTPRSYEAARGAALTDTMLHNRYAYIPPQCYTQTRDGDGGVHNPCFACHVRSRAPNFIADADLQLEYGFAKPATENAWTNLFVDRRAAIAATADDEIQAYTRESNYFAQDGTLALAATLRDLPAAWDDDGDGHWRGYVPDAYFRFDGQGFDLDPTGKPTGWRAFAYYPFPGTFWPTNGSAGDVLIRLPREFRESEAGVTDLRAYRINLAVVEALTARRDVPIDPVDERLYEVDLDQDGKWGEATQITYLSVQAAQRHMSYVGRARALQAIGAARLVKGLFPQGTEFLHSVRYLGVQAGQVGMAPRMKELRYARKVGWVSVLSLDELAAAETKEADAFPDRLRTLIGTFEDGVNNGQGWRYQGFIEDAEGALRPQTFEETAFCVGCHSGIGATVDGIFSLPRKLPADAHARGWFHWSQRGLRGIPEPRRADARYEYTLYLEQNGAGDEFRANDEVLERFFDGVGALRAEPIEALHEDISTLLLPSPSRALALNKAYREVVREQSFVRGRDAVLAPAALVHRRVREGQTTGVDEPVTPGWAR